MVSRQQSHDSTALPTDLYVDVGGLIVDVEEQGNASLEPHHQLVSVEVQGHHHHLVVIAARIPEANLCVRVCVCVCGCTRAYV